MTTRYAGHPTALVFEDAGGKPGKAKIEELLWGDEIDLQGEANGDFVKVKVKRSGGGPRRTGWMRTDAMTDQPLLEITFIDIGQGDGCVLTTPDGRTVVIDAGKRDNMVRYLQWRFNYPSAKFPKQLDAAVISHPDDDHYLGFRDVFKHPGLSFGTVFHNGLVERKGDSPLGPRTDAAPKVFTDLIRTKAQLRKLLDKDAALPSTKQYPDMLRLGLDAGKFDEFTMLCRDDGFMPGFEADRDISIEVLGPVVETDAEGAIGLRRLGSTGETKNGHSVVLRLTYGNTRVLLGGDLNVPSEKLLLETFLGRPLPTTARKRADFLKEARSRFEVDIAKSCHHGSADFSSLFLEAVNPVATVISSGDSEAHSHPRAETLGAIGVASRGARPLIYSTELARSARDAIQDPVAVRRELKKSFRAVLEAPDSKKRSKLATAFRKRIDTTIQKSVQTYGAIYLRTDGTRALIGHMFESNRPGKMYDLCALEPGADGRLEYHSTHAD